MIGEIRILASHCLAGRYVFGFKIDTIGRQNEFGLRLACCRAVSKFTQSLADFTFPTNSHMDVVTLENATFNI